MKVAFLYTCMPVAGIFRLVDHSYSAVCVATAGSYPAHLLCSATQVSRRGIQNEETMTAYSNIVTAFRKMFWKKMRVN